MAVDEIQLRWATVDDAGEILTLQRAAFVTEAQAYGTTALPQLTQSLEELEAELGRVQAHVALDGSRIVGAVRLDANASVGEITNLMVAPDWQGQGVATRLMRWAELHAPVEVSQFELQIGHKSHGNLALGNRLGYEVCRRERINATLTLVFMTKLRCGLTPGLERSE